MYYFSQTEDILGKSSQLQRFGGGCWLSFRVEVRSGLRFGVGGGIQL